MVTSTKLCLQQVFELATVGTLIESVLDEIELRKLTKEDLSKTLGVSRVAVSRALKAWQRKPIGKHGLIERSSLLLKLLTYLGCGFVDSVCLPHEKALAGLECAMRENRRIRQAGYEPKVPLSLYPLTTLYVALRIKQMGLGTLSLEDIKHWVGVCVATVKAECEFFEAKRKSTPWFVKSDDGNVRDLFRHVGPRIGSLKEYAEFCKDWLPDFEAVLEAVPGLDIYFTRLGWAQHKDKPIRPTTFNLSRVVADAGVSFFYDAETESVAGG